MPGDHRSEVTLFWGGFKSICSIKVIKCNHVILFLTKIEFNLIV